MPADFIPPRKSQIPKLVAKSSAILLLALFAVIVEGLQAEHRCFLLGLAGVMGIMEGTSVRQLRSRA